MKKVLLIISLLFSFTVMAKDGSSGCGPGWYIFKKNSLVSSALRFTTNAALVPLVTLGMTLGTSNCSQHKLVKTEKESLKFATENYYEIAADAARGEEQFLDSFASTIGCKKDSQKVFNQKMQKNLGKYFQPSKVNPEELLKQTYIFILQDKELVQSCSLG